MVRAVPRFELVSDFAPAGDQPRAIAELSAGVERGDRFQTLLGITGSGKSFTIAGLIQLQMQRTLNWGLGGALSVVLLLVTSVIVYAYQRRYGLDRLFGGGR